MTDEYKGEAHYWTDDADGDPVRSITSSPLTPGKWYREHTAQQLADEHAYRRIPLPSPLEENHKVGDVELLAQSLRANDEASGNVDWSRYDPAPGGRGPYARHSIPRTLDLPEIKVMGPTQQMFRVPGGTVVVSVTTQFTPD